LVARNRIYLQDLQRINCMDRE